MNNLFKKSIVLLVIVLVCSVVFPGASMNVSALISSGKCGNDMYYVIADDGTITISGTGFMSAYSPETKLPWYSHKSKIKKLVVEDGVQSLTSNAFKGCTNLTSVSFGDGFAMISGYALANTGITEITVPDTVEIIASNAFGSCSLLETVTFEGNADLTIMSRAFSGCLALDTVCYNGADIPKSIDTNAFDNPANIKVYVAKDYAGEDFGGIAVERIHNHRWDYTKDGNTITATCVEEGCSDTNGGSVSIAPPINTAYTGDVIEPVVTNSLVDKSTPVNVVYTPENELTYGRPINAGTYTATITLGEAEISVSYTILATYEISFDISEKVSASYTVDGGEAITDFSKTRVVKDSIVELTLIPEEGYYIKSVKYDSYNISEMPVVDNKVSIKITGTGTIKVTAAELMPILPAVISSEVKSVASYTFGEASGRSAVIYVKVDGGFRYNIYERGAVLTAGGNPFRLPFDGNYNVFGVRVISPAFKVGDDYSMQAYVSGDFGEIQGENINFVFSE